MVRTEVVLAMAVLALLCTFSEDPGLQDRAKTMTCGEPRLRALGRYIKNCILNYNNNYPANNMTCTVCAKSVQLECWRREDGLLSWYPVVRTAEELCTDTVPIPPPLSQCPAPKDTPYNCRNEEENGLEGNIINCLCKSNCRNVTIDCRNDGKWHIQDASKSDLCSTPILNNKKQPLHISFSNQAYSYSCAPGYHLVGGASTRICRNGVLDGSEPSCELGDETATTSGTSTGNTMPSGDKMATAPQGGPLTFILIGTISVLVLMSVSLVLYIWYRYREATVKPPTCNISVVHNPTFQAPEDPDYDYPELNYVPKLEGSNGPPLPLNRPEENLYDYPELNIPIPEEENYDYPVLKPRPENNVPQYMAENEIYLQRENNDQEYVVNDLYVPVAD